MKTLVVLDHANINRGAKDLGYELDYGVLLHDHLASQDEGRFLIEALAYVAINPRQEHKKDAEIENLWKAGYFVNSKVGTIAGNSYKCDFDIEITMDVMKMAYHTKPDIVVLVSGDSDFIPVVKELRQMGIRVEIASFPNITSKYLSLISSGFIDLNVYLEDDEMIDNEEENDFEEIQTENEQIQDLQNENNEG